MNLNQIVKRMNFLIHHYDRSDVTDWIILKHELQKWEKEQQDHIKKIHHLKEEMEQLKREMFDLFLLYDPQLVIKELQLDSSEFLRKKKENSWTKAEIEKIMKELVYE